MHIVIYPLEEGRYRVEVKRKAGVPPFGPIQKVQIVSEDAIASVVRQTAISADLAAALSHPQIGPVSNIEERLRQIKRIAERFAKE